MSKPSRDLPILTSLRALSIILVLISHNPLHPIPFAVVGVDIFFLISGYLITQQLVLYKPKLSTFYFHRLRRILPSLLTTSFAVLLVIRNLRNSTLFISTKLFATKSILLINNFYQIKLSHNYFHDYLENPLSSLWSLSVEMQIYLVIPFLIYLFLLSKKRNLLLAGGVTFLTLLISLLIQNNRYFQTLPRFGDFMIGSTLFFGQNLGRKYTLKRIHLKTYLFVLLTTILFFRDSISSFPSIISYGVVILTAYYLITNSENSKNNHLINYVGTRSYNIYLLYLPVIVLLTLKNNSKVIYLLILPLILILAELLYRLDIFCRRNLTTPAKVLPLIAFLLLSNILTIVIPINFSAVDIKNVQTYQQLYENILYANTTGFPVPNANEISRLTSEPIIFTNENSSKNSCSAFEICKIPATLKYDRTLLLIADSTAREFAPLLVKEAERKKINFIYYNLAGCDVTGLSFDKSSNYSDQACLTFQKNILPYLKGLNLKAEDLSIIFQQASDPNREKNNKTITNKARNQKFISTMQMLKQFSKHINVISEIPFPTLKGGERRINQTFPFQCLSKYNNTRTCSFPLTENLTSQIINLNKRYSLENQINYIDQRKYLCYNGSCPVVVNNILTYIDPFHISHFYANSISKIFLSDLEINW